MGCLQKLFFLRRLQRQMLKIEATIGINGGLAIPCCTLKQIYSAAAAEYVADSGDKAAAATGTLQRPAACSAENVASRIDVIAVHDCGISPIASIYSPQVALIALCSSPAVVFFRM